MAGFWICLVNVSQAFELTSGFKYARVQSMYGKEYARITQGAEYTWISLIYDNDLRHERVNNTEYEYIA